MRAGDSPEVAVIEGENGGTSILTRQDDNGCVGQADVEAGVLFDDGGSGRDVRRAERSQEIRAPRYLTYER